MGKTGGGVGSNQYGRRGTSHATSKKPLRNADAMYAMGYERCGSVWLTRCQVWVSGPDWSHGEHPGIESRKFVATSRSPLHARFLGALSEDDNLEVRQGVAMNQSATPEILDKLADDPDLAIQRRVAENPSTSRRTLAKLAESQDGTVLARVAMNPRTSSETRRLLLPILGEHDRLTAIERIDPSLLPEADRMLRRYASITARIQLRPDTPGQVLSLLADYPHSGVRAQVVQHANTPQETIFHMAAYGPAHERPMAVWYCKDQGYLSRLANDEDYTMRKSVAQNHHTSPETLAKLSRDHTKAVLREVARNSHTPPEVLAKLAGNRMMAVRLAAAWNPNTPAEILAKLAKDEDENVREAVAWNHHTPPDVLTVLALEDDAGVRRAAAQNPSLPEHMQAVVVLAGDPDGE